MDKKVVNILDKKGASEPLSFHNPINPPCKNKLKDFCVLKDREKIVEILVAFKYERTAIFLVADDGRNIGKTLLTEFSQNVLTIDKPFDYSETSPSTFRLYFQDKKNLWGFFEVRVIGESANSLSTTYPLAYFQLQRRKDHRINAPEGTTAFIYQREAFLFGGNVKDLSGTGMLIIDKENDGQLKPDSEFDEITINLPDKSFSRGNKIVKAEYTLVIGKGKVVRTHYDKKLKSYYYGVSFEDRKDRFKKALINYFD